LTFGIAYSYIVDAGGIWKVFNGSGFVPLIMILISVLLFTPWFIRYQHNQHYKKTYSDIKDSVNLLNETV